MSDEKLYVKADLEDYANIDAIEDDPNSWSSPSRAEILQQALDLTEDEVHVVNGGGYTGSMLFIFETEGYLWVIQDEYGSCEQCDGLIGRNHAKEYATTLMRDAYAFTDPCDAEPFLKEKSNEGINRDGLSYGWKPVVGGGLEILEEEYE